MKGLSITRRVNESFTIGPNITVTVTKMGGVQVKLLIDAPKELAIKRDNIVNDKPRTEVTK